MREDHGSAAEHVHGVTVGTDRRWLLAAAALIVSFMAVEVIVGLLAGSLALISDAGHMLTDAAALVLALVAMRVAARPAGGRFTYGFSRAEILSAAANGITLLLLTAWFCYEGVRRLIDPPAVAGATVLATGLAAILVNLGATWLLGRANRSSLNVEGAFAHIVNDLFAAIATSVSGLVVWLTGFARADAIAAFVIAALMARAGWVLVRDSGRIFLEAAPAGVDPDDLGGRLAGLTGVIEVHDLHVWQITSGAPALSAHVLVRPGVDCHTVRDNVEAAIRDGWGIDHLTLQVDHARTGHDHCAQSHGTVHRAAG